MQHTLGSASLGGITQAKSVERPVTAFDGIATALDRSALLVARVEQLRDRLLGARPENKIGGPVPTAAGLLDDYAERARCASARIDDALSALNEIERAIP